MLLSDSSYGEDDNQNDMMRGEGLCVQIRRLKVVLTKGDTYEGGVGKSFAFTFRRWHQHYYSCARFHLKSSKNKFNNHPK